MSCLCLNLLKFFFHEHQVVVGIAPALTWLICILGPMRFTPRLPAFWHVQHNLNLIWHRANLRILPLLVFSIFVTISPPPLYLIVLSVTTNLALMEARTYFTKVSQCRSKGSPGMNSSVFFWSVSLTPVKWQLTYPVHLSGICLWWVSFNPSFLPCSRTT